MICLAGGSWSYDLSAKHLAEFCGLKVSDNKIRDVCQSRGAKMAKWQRETSEPREAFEKAKGEQEFTTDGTCVNTWDGWREMRIGIFSKRPMGQPATPEEWADRQLPSTTVRVAFAAIEKSDRFGSRWGKWAGRLGIRDTSQLSVLADGARWIWEESSMHFAGARETLDIYHALEHIGDAAKALYPNDTDAAEQWLATCREAILSEGYPGIAREIVKTRQTATKVSQKKSLNELATYLGNNASRLGYAQRLAEGRAIGSGQVEGACKHMIGKRLKQTGARWRVRRVNRMASLCSLIYSNQWDSYWNAY